MQAKSLYAQYIQEREGFEIIEDELGFATYIISGDECYIRDIYVLPEYRKINIASSYSDQIAKIAKEKGCKVLTGTVFPSAKGSTESLMAVIKSGFKIANSTNEKIILIKEL